MILHVCRRSAPTVCVCSRSNVEKIDKFYGRCKEEMGSICLRKSSGVPYMASKFFSKSGSLMFGGPVPTANYM